MIANSSRGQVLSSQELMSLALKVARHGVRGANPLVGAVLASSRGRVLQTGWHRGAGTVHAEVDAIERAHAAGIDTRGGHLYVTLEPCNHTGRTGPCTRAIVDAGIARVYFSCSDSTDKASGGAAHLRAQGVEVEQGLCEQESLELNQRWFLTADQGRPWVTGKIASSLDSFIAAADGSSQWITGEQARADGHSIRARADAVLVGTETVLRDDPRLSARNERGEHLERQPLSVVMGKREIPAHAALRRGRWTQIFTHSPQRVVDELSADGVNHLMIEGGPTVLTSFLRESLVDELFWYRAPILLGAGRRGVDDLGLGSLAEADRWSLDDLTMTPALQQLGADVSLHLIPAYQPQGSASTTLTEIQD